MKNGASNLATAVPVLNDQVPFATRKPRLKTHLELINADQCLDKNKRPDDPPPRMPSAGTKKSLVKKVFEDQEHGEMWAARLSFDDADEVQQLTVQQFDDGLIAEWARLVVENTAEIKEAKLAIIDWNKSLKKAKASVKIAIDAYPKGLNAVKMVDQDSPDAMWEMLGKLKATVGAEVVSRKEDRLFEAILGRI